MRQEDRKKARIDEIVAKHIEYLGDGVSNAEMRKMTGDLIGDELHSEGVFPFEHEPEAEEIETIEESVRAAIRRQCASEGIDLPNIEEAVRDCREAIERSLLEPQMFHATGSL